MTKLQLIMCLFAYLFLLYQHLIILLIKPGNAGQRLVHGWFFEIDFVSMMCYLCVSVCPPLRHSLEWILCDQLTL